MLPFFRRIRQNLISDKRFSNYLLYALGEIALVVVGILIALQVNTWNNQRDLRKKERVYLKEIRLNIEDDLQNLRYSIAFNQRKDSVITECIQVMLSHATHAEAASAITQHMPVLAEFSVFTQNRVAFDNMLSAENIDLISNDTLRTLLSTYYAEQNLLDGTQERVKELTRLFVDHVTPLLMNREMIEGNFKVENEFEPAATLNLKTNRVLFGDLFGMQMNLRSHLIYLRDYEQEVTTLLEQISLFTESEE